jgi:hypothetical protein
MKRDVGAHMTLTVTEPAELIFSMAVASGADLASERLLVSLDGAAVEAEELVDSHGTRLHRVEVGTGDLEASYTATILGHTAEEELIPTDLIRYLRPSRYCESDILAPTAAAEFQGLEGVDLLDAVSSWVGTRLWYVSGSSLPTDGALILSIGGFSIGGFAKRLERLGLWFYVDTRVAGGPGGHRERRPRGTISSVM